MSEELLLKQRAEKLAKVTHVKEKSGNIDLVEFMLGNETYAIESIYIREVYPFKDLTPLPSVPSFVAGIVNIRRKIISVLNLKNLFGLNENPDNSQSKIIVLQKNGRDFGIIADSIVGVLSLNAEELQGPLPTMTGIRQELLKGITNYRLIVLDGEKLLTHSSLLVDESVS